jgi:hypothetical protein
MEIPRIFALPIAAADRLCRGVSMIAISAIVASMPLAVAQQYPSPTYLQSRSTGRAVRRGANLLSLLLWDRRG